MALEIPFLPPGYDPATVAAAAAQYAASRGYVPHMVMQEGHVEVRDGVPGIMVKYVDRDGLTTTEWTPLPVKPPAAAAPAAGGGPPPPARDMSVEDAMTQRPAKVPDAENPRAVAYALKRLGQLRNLGIAYQDMGDPTATWRKASESIAGLASKQGFANPRDLLRFGNQPQPRLPRGTPLGSLPSPAAQAVAAGAARVPPPAVTQPARPDPLALALTRRPRGRLIAV